MDEQNKTSELRIKDEGHLNLINDLSELLQEAMAGEFHDFANKKYPAPKMALNEKLHIIRMGVVNGRYDNSPKEVKEDGQQ